MTLEAIREATNKAWILGSGRFKRRIANQLDRPVTSGGHGEIADRKPVSERPIINESDPVIPLGYLLMGATVAISCLSH